MSQRVKRKCSSAAADHLQEAVDFLLYLDKLKRVNRHTSISDGTRRENVAEHSWHVATFALIVGERNGANVPHVIKMLLVHDVLEIELNIDGEDIYLHDLTSRELEDLEHTADQRMMDAAPNWFRGELEALRTEFKERKSVEAKLAWAIDRAHPIILNIANGGDVWHRKSTSFDKVKNLIAPIAEFDSVFHSYLQDQLDSAREDGCFPD